MIPRFNYSYSLQDAWCTLQGLMSGRSSNASSLSALFPASVTYGVSSARAGIYYALRAFNLKPGARVGIQPYTCSSVFAAIVATGYTPVFIDVNQQLTIDIDDLRRKRPDLDALIITHTFGIPAQIETIQRIVGSLPVIEDCAHAFLSHYKGRLVGSFFDAAVFSFGAGKFPSFGSGGMLVINFPRYTNSIETMLRSLVQPSLLPELTLIAKRLVHSLVHSRTGSTLMEWILNKSIRSNRNKQPLAYPVRDSLPMRSVTYALQRQFENLTKRALLQYQNARYLVESNKENYTMLIDADAGNAFAVVLIAEDRDALYTYLRTKGIGAGKHFQHAQTWAMAFGYLLGQCPNFEELVDKILTIPCHDSLTMNELKKISQCLGEFARQLRPIHEKDFSRY